MLNSPVLGMGYNLLSNWPKESHNQPLPNTTSYDQGYWLLSTTSVSKALLMKIQLMSSNTEKLN